jgi:uncharacterized membrane protein YkoI
MNRQNMLIGITTACAILFSSPAAWAGDGLQRVSMPYQHATISTNVNDQHSMREWNVRSSVQVTRDTLREAYDASRSAYTSKLQKYAKCTPKQAEKAVSTAHPGMKINHVQLRNIRTSLVYIGVAEDDQDKYLVVIDAGNAKVLMDRPLPTHHERVFANK